MVSDAQGKANKRLKLLAASGLLAGATFIPFFRQNMATQEFNVQSAKLASVFLSTRMFDSDGKEIVDTVLVFPQHKNNKELPEIPSGILVFPTEGSEEVLRQKAKTIMREYNSLFESQGHDFRLGSPRAITELKEGGNFLLANYYSLKGGRKINVWQKLRDELKIDRSRGALATKILFRSRDEVKPAQKPKDFILRKSPMRNVARSSLQRHRNRR